METNSSYLTVAAGGGFGTVYLLNDGSVIKAIYGKESCQEAQIEYGKQLRIYNSFKELKKNNKYSSSRIINLVNEYVKISKPYNFMDKSTKINDTTYSCTIRMSRLNGISLKNFSKLDSNIINRFSKEFLESRGLDFEIMGHLALNSDISGVYGITYTNKLISNKNPPRGFFITENSGLLDKLRKTFKLQLSNNEIKEIIGFIYGYIMFNTNIIPIDIEITLGLYNNKFKINVLDFGMCFNLDNINDNPILPRTVTFFDILNNNKLSSIEKYNKIIEQGKDDISIDLYGDVNTDEYNIIGFNEAYNLSKNKIKSIDYSSYVMNIKKCSVY